MHCPYPSGRPPWWRYSNTRKMPPFLEEASEARGEHTGGGTLGGGNDLQQVEDVGVLEGGEDLDFPEGRDRKLG